ncbi:hypothetical protein [Geotalea sp. SG265]|uniref:hypothetical protein n=1 Tax=Geotalea sp. SG265 TaxID=2922867 RepID=UPI001FAF1134|nr:hypothetical protein [Geotalea sp. SG265]
MNKWIVAVLMIGVVAGCGIEWFPEDNATSGDKNKDVSFSFAGKNKCSVPAGSNVDSGPIEIFNLQTTATISVSGATTSRYTIIGENSPRTAPATIRPGQSVSVTHQAATPDATSKIVITTLRIAGKEASFKSTTDPCAQGTTTFE